MGIFDFFKKKSNEPLDEGVTGMDEGEITQAVEESLIDEAEQAPEPPLAEEANEPKSADEVLEAFEALRVEEESAAEQQREAQIENPPEAEAEPLTEAAPAEESVAEVSPEPLGALPEDASETQEEADESVASEEPPGQEKKKGLFARLTEGLAKTRSSILGGVDNVLKIFTKVDEELFEELEEALIMSDIGVNASTEIIGRLREKVRLERITDGEGVKKALEEIIRDILISEEDHKPFETPAVILIVGVNGVGKTTTIGKLASKFRSENKKVVVAAADTFRAAAIDQLEIWGRRAGIEVIKQGEGSDPGAVIFDAISAAKARKADVLICDTAGRLHNKKNLMDELGKINKIIDSQYEQAHKETYIVLDSTAGQNSLQQAKTFKEVCDITGIVLTKLDGTAKGGIVVAIKSELAIPVKYIGVGEGVDDLQVFNAEDFAQALFAEK